MAAAVNIREIVNPRSDVKGETRSSFVNNPILRMFLWVCILACLVQTGCASRTKAIYQTNVTYQRKGFNSEGLAGRTVFVLPVMNRTGVDSTAQKILMGEKEWVDRNHGSIEFFFGDTFANIYERRHGEGSWSGLCKSLSEGDVMVLQTNDRFWRLFKNDYILILRMNNGVRIKTFEGKQTQRVSLESELWCKDSAEVFWRAQISGYGADSTTVDRVFIRDALRHVFVSLPGVKTASDNDNEW